MEADRRKSMMAEVVLEEFIEDCMLCTLGRSSEIMSCTVSRGSLIEDRQCMELCETSGSYPCCQEVTQS